MNEQIILFNESLDGDRPAVTYGALTVDESGRLIFTDNEKSFRLQFIQTNDMGYIEKLLKQVKPSSNG